MVEARFQLYQDIAKKYRFRLRAPNTKIVTVGEDYESKAGCLKGINAVKKYCDSPIEDLSKGEEKKPVPKFQVYKDRNEKYRFHLIAPNYEIVAVSEPYESKTGCLNGINAVKSYCGADVEDLTPSARKVTPPTAGGEDIILSLDEPQSTAENGSSLTFTGKLLRGSLGVSGQKINIYERDRSFMQDDFMASGETRDDGSFGITWVAKKMDWWDDTVEVYARYMEAGSRRFIPIHSETFVITII